MEASNSVIFAQQNESEIPDVEKSLIKHHFPQNLQWHSINLKPFLVEGSKDIQNSKGNGGEKTSNDQTGGDSFSDTYMNIDDSRCEIKICKNLEVVKPKEPRSTSNYLPR